MIGKGARPRTLLAIDIALLGLLVSAVVSTLIEHITEQAHLRFMMHRIHGITGIGLCLLLGLHLLLHLPWIQGQLRRIHPREPQPVRIAPQGRHPLRRRSGDLRQ